ncbi:MAG: hypothetical protein WC794_00840 [Candidatus Doudnabacteria bacterium]|jgi:hypothetical protein
MDKPNLLNSPDEKPLQQPAVEDYQYFNVMPKETEPSKMVEPQIKSTEPQAINEPAIGSVAGFDWKKYRLYIIGTLVLLILGPLTYFLINKFVSSSYKPENFIVDRNKIAAEQAKKTPDQPATDFKTPREWRDKYFPACADDKTCGDNADPDRDGLTNLQEQQLTTDPNNPDSDQDGLSDGDEINIFQSNALESHTGKDPKYNDGDFIKGGYDITTNKLMDSAKISDISQKMKTLGLHQPTITTLQDALLKIYKFAPGDNTESASSTPPTSQTTTANPLEGLDISVEAKQDRDTQRSATIKNLEVALVKYQVDNKNYPVINDFTSMYNMVKPYLRVATNPVDPVNKDVFVYSYTAESGGKDFILSFYSEVANQIIKKRAADAQKDALSEQSNIYDDQRKNDLENIRSALLIYSNKNIAGTQEYVFPGIDKYKTALVPEIMSVIPKDPKTGQDYLYQVSDTFNSFTLKAMLDNAPVGFSGYLCNQEECRTY